MKNIKKKDSLGMIVFVYTVATPIMGLLLMWFNYLSLGARIPYWKFVILGCLLLWLKRFSEVISSLYTALLIMAIVVQTLAWIKLVTIPLFK